MTKTVPQRASEFFADRVVPWALMGVTIGMMLCGFGMLVIACVEIVHLLGTVL